MKNCKQCQSSFEVTAADQRFLKELTPCIEGKMYSIPEPTLCPSCRLQRRMCFRNERSLYHRKSDLSGKQIISIYSPNKPFPVYDQEEWWSDKWDGLEQGRDFDFSRPFFEQFRELCLVTPQISLYTTNVENSTYTNFTLNLKNCYLMFGGAHLEDVYFSKFMTNCNTVLDSLSLYNCERCYEGIASRDCYSCLFFKNSRNCSDCLMIEDCEGLRDSLMCFGLRNKRYCFLNEEVGKEKYESILAELLPLTPKKIQMMFAKFNALKESLPHPNSHIYASENCVGDHLSNCKNCFYCFDMENGEDCRYVMMNPNSKFSMDCTYGSPDGVEFSYENISGIGTRLMGCFMVWYGDQVFYSMECMNSKDLFGCVGLKNKQYCILNKQYSKEEYYQLVDRIIQHMRDTGEWGEFFDPSLSHMGYNETIAQEYFPLTKEEALEKGFQWFDEADVKKYKGPAIKIPEDIQEVSDDITDKILTCEVTGMPYKIIPQELQFYREMNLPLPRRSPNQRHKDRLKKRPPYALWNRDCDRCKKTMMSNFSPEGLEKVYCETCYLNQIY